MTIELLSTVRRPAMSFQSRITAAAMLTAVAVLMAACTVFVFEQWRTDQRALVNDQTAVVRQFASGPISPMALAHPDSAAQLMSLLRGAAPTPEAAYLFDAAGNPVAHFGPTDPEAARGRGMKEATALIQRDGRTLGRLTTMTREPPLGSILPRYLALAAALLIGASALSLLLGRWLAVRVTKPMERLSQVMREVAASGDVSKQVERTSDDELGQLTDSFNDLLSKLHVKDTALRQTLDELVEARDAAEAANRLKSQFLANMSHEIRTPMNGLLAMSQVMALDDLSPLQRGRLEIVRQSGEALLAILNDVLDVSKIEAGKLELELGEFDTEVLAGGVHAAFLPVAERKGLSLTLEVQPLAQGARLGDAARLRQILSNLVSNALKFTHKGEVAVRISGHGLAGSEGLKLEVSDTGIGISPEAMPLLFQKFTQADATTTRRFGGTGLGLAICHDLAQMMGGRIWVESVEGEGSTFHIILPLPRIAEHEAPAVVAAAPHEAMDEEQPMRVLAAEDNPTNQLVLKTVMGIFGVELTMVENGRLAVAAWETGTFDVILMDIQMPEMDGMAATRMIRAKEIELGRPRVPIIALSAHAMTHQVKEYLDAGIDLHVPKPIELPRLQAALEQAVSGGTGAQAAA
jgi:signal transduction histidine kinase